MGSFKQGACNRKGRVIFSATGVEPAAIYQYQWFPRWVISKLLNPCKKVSNQKGIKYSDWCFTGKITDNPKKDKICELCDKEGLRWEFEIKNDNNSETLIVGSSCIIKFSEIIVYDEHKNKIIDKNQRKAHLDNERKVYIRELSLKPLRILYITGKKHYRHRIKQSVDFLKEKNGFRSDHLLFLFKKMESLNIVYEPSFYPVYLGDEESRTQLEKIILFDKNALVLLFNSLTSAQRKRYNLFNTTQNND